MNHPGLNIAVTIVGYRNAEDIKRCLEALEATEYPSFQTVIVENGGDAAFSALEQTVSSLLAANKAIQLVNTHQNLGFAGGVNTGIRLTPGADAWWILNPDTVPAPQALSALVSRLEKGDCSAVGGVLHFADGTVQSLGGHWRGWLGQSASLGAGSHINDSVDPATIEQSLSYLVGASMLVHKRFVNAVGLMREDYFLYAEEVEWFLRGRERGIKLGFAPEAHVLHFQGTTTGWGNTLNSRPKMPVYLDERNRLLVTRDRFPLRFPIVALLALAVMVMRFARKKAWRQMGYALQGWLAGVAGHRGPPPWVRPS